MFPQNHENPVISGMKKKTRHILRQKCMHNTEGHLFYSKNVGKEKLNYYFCIYLTYPTLTGKRKCCFPKTSTFLVNDFKDSHTSLRKSKKIVLFLACPHSS